MKIIFFHHAGGDKYSFLPYKDLLENIGWEAVIYEFPGHGDRYNEDLLNDASKLAEDAYISLKQDFTGDYILFGNSMGSLIAYLVLHLIWEDDLQLPVHFFAASRKCPASYPPLNRNQPLSHEKFWSMIGEYGGPEALRTNTELQKLYEPILRADYNILESYEHVFKEKFPVSATVLYGNRDRYSSEELESWQQHFGKDVSLIEFDGGHFFAMEQADTVLQLIRESIVY